MNTPFLSLLVTALLRLFAAVLACLSLSHCAHSDQKPVTDKAALRTEWCLASKEPLTYCPKGRALPAGPQLLRARRSRRPRRGERARCGA